MAVVITTDMTTETQYNQKTTSQFHSSMIPPPPEQISALGEMPYEV